MKIFVYILMRTQIVLTDRHVIWHKRLIFCIVGGFVRFEITPGGGFIPGYSPINSFNLALSMMSNGDHPSFQTKKRKDKKGGEIYGHRGKRPSKLGSHYWRIVSCRSEHGMSLEPIGRPTARLHLKPRNKSGIVPRRPLSRAPAF